NNDYRTTAPEGCAFETVASNDGGRSWQARGSEQRFEYRKATGLDDAQVRFVAADATTGWLIGGHPEVTHDGGRSWAPEPLPGVVTDLDPAGSGAWALVRGCAADQQCAPTLYRLTGGRWEVSPSPPSSV